MTVTDTLALGADEHPFASVTVTLNEPEVVTVIDCVTAPVDHKYDVANGAVSITEPPAQKVVGPPAVIVGVAGSGFTVTVIGALAAEVQPNCVSVTVYVPFEDTVIDCVNSLPGDQVLPEVAEEVSTTEPPAQNVVGPPAVMVGVGGIGFTVTFTAVLELEIHPFPSIT